MFFSLWNFFLNKGFCRGVTRKSDASEAAQWQSEKGARTHCPLALNLLSSSQRDWKGSSSSAGCTAWKLPPQRVKAENRWCWCSKTRSSLVSTHRGSFPQSCLQRWLVAPDNLRFSAMRICFKWKEGFCLMTSRPQWKAWFPHWQQGRGLPRSTLAPGIASSRTSGWTCIGSQERPWGWLKVSEMSCSNV